jgi:hypothetical protein
MRRSRKWNATLETAQRGEVEQLPQRNSCLTSPVAPSFSVARLLLDRRDIPSSEEVTNPPLFRFIFNHQRWATAPIARDYISSIVGADYFRTVGYLIPS